MTKVTDFRLVDENGDRALSDAFGNNVAFKCVKCGHPMLAIILPKQIRAWLVAEPAKKLLRLRSSD
jgi:hypothetical protein